MTDDGDRPSYPHQAGKPWQPEARALAVRALEQARNTPDATQLLEQWATWPDGSPSGATLRKWAKDHSIPLAPRHPETAGYIEAAREHRTLRMETARADLAELLIDRLSRPAAEAIAARLDEVPEVEARIAEARRDLDESLLYLNVAKPTVDADGKVTSEGLGLDAIKSALAMVRHSARMLDAELSQRINIRDLVGIVTRGVADHMTLEGLDAKDSDAGDIIVEIFVPEAVAPRDARAVEIVPQHALPERTD